ncbi:ervatamin-C-like [Panicum virgatum]|uniref:ervatamin-C-like n=1 Tax=Panicum virgatum TaxID=38727 RepID=UPI0019D60D96|nr:ervatamin-C-like [Panicum virgatum]
MAMVVVMALAPAASAMEFSQSEKATLALYERWSVRYSVAREASDTARRLAIFTDSARRVLNESSSYIAINVFDPAGEDRALSYVTGNGGMAPESAYPYEGRQGPCQKVVGPLIPIDGYTGVPPYSELELRAAVARQPVVVSVESSGMEFKQYPGGIFDGPCGSAISHQMTTVGYGTTETGEAFWLLKNSWGASLGEDGFMRMAREVGSEGDGLCGIHMHAFYPTWNLQEDCNKISV